MVEQLAIYCAKSCSAHYANVQPISAPSVNFAVYTACRNQVIPFWV
ncbi:hypothetical protein ACNKHU_15460 [Shigella flexneri]